MDRKAMHDPNFPDSDTTGFQPEEIWKNAASAQIDNRAEISTWMRVY
jgi:hypothetical protein